MQTIWKNCGILFGKIVAFHLEELRQTQFSLIYTRLHRYRQSSHICGNFNISKITFCSASRAVVLTTTSTTLRPNQLPWALKE